MMNNKMLLMIVVVCLVISGMIISASVLSESQTSHDNQTKKMMEMNSVPSSEQVANIDPSKMNDFSLFHKQVMDFQANLRDLANRVELFEQSQSELSQKYSSLESQIENLKPSYRSVSETGSQELKCNVTGYLTRENTPVPNSEINYGTLNQELSSGNKKVQMVCSF